MAHVIFVGLAQGFNQCALFYPDAIEQPDERTGEACPIRQCHSHAQNAEGPLQLQTAEEAARVSSPIFAKALPAMVLPDSR